MIQGLFPLEHKKKFAVSFKGQAGDIITLSQTINYRLIQTERVCRRQFQIWWKCQKVLQMGRKQYEKRRNRSLRAISLFPAVFPKFLQSICVKTTALLGIWVNPFPNKPWFLRVCTTSLLKRLWEKEKLLRTSNFSFFHSLFYPFWEHSGIFI